MNNVSHDTAFIQAMLQLGELVVTQCYWLLPTLITLTLIATLARGLTQNRGLRVNYFPVVRGFVILFTVFFYGELMGVVSGGIGGFAGLLPQTKNIHASLHQMIQERTGKDVSGNSLQDYLDTVAGVFRLDFYQLVGNFLSTGVVSVLRRILELLRQSLLGFLYVTGPLALTLSVVPALEGLALRWFQNYLSVQCWSITLIVLDNMVALYAKTFAKGYTSAYPGEEFTQLNFIIVSVTTTLLYLMVPYLTSLFMGTVASSQFPSRMAGIASAGAGLLGAGARYLYSKNTTKKT
ncbi:hypothetical protein AAG747_28300 [Rapidithrix thailandica]|uniref:Uncharacterized protein n=1 Tax=Rapidithrix thailandica TaxID=413964 RepID=A0AAW9SFL0_9BACT